MTTLGVYRPGCSLLHRMPTGIKLFALVVAILAVSIFVREPWQLAAPRSSLWPCTRLRAFLR